MLTRMGTAAAIASIASIALIVACLAAAVPASAQQSLQVLAGGGPTFPIGRYGDVAETGWMVNVAGLASPLDGVWGGAEVMYGRNGVRIANESYTLVGAGAILGLSLNTDQRLSPFVFGSAGFLSQGTTSVQGGSHTGAAFGLGAGLSYDVSPVISIEAFGRVITASIDQSTVRFVPVGIFARLRLGEPGGLR